MTKKESRTAMWLQRLAGAGLRPGGLILCERPEQEIGVAPIRLLRRRGLSRSRRRGFGFRDTHKAW